MTAPEDTIARAPTRFWYVACESHELGREPLARTVLSVPVVLFRDGGGVARALVDRCPHRNMPLSAGRLTGDGIQCAYHGWTFDGSGACRDIPGLAGTAGAPGRNALAWPAVERDGLVWVFADEKAPPGSTPFALPLLDDASYSTARLRSTVEAPLAAALENILDVPHTAVLHGGLFRTEHERREVSVIVRRTAQGIEAEYVGESRPEGLLGRLLAPRGGVVQHVDRFLLPSIAQVEYALGDESHLLATHLLTPITETRTRMIHVVTFKVRLPGWLLAPFVRPLASTIARQDARVLARQAENVRRFGGERFTSTELDVLGPPVRRLLEQADREGPVTGPREWTLRMML